MRDYTIGTIYRTTNYGGDEEFPTYYVILEDKQIKILDGDGKAADVDTLTDIYSGLEKSGSTRKYVVWHDNKHNANSDVNARYYAQTSDRRWRLYGKDVTTEQVSYRHRPETLRERSAYYFAKVYNELRKYAGQA